MNQPVRKRTDADATETNQLDVTGIFCGKLLSCPAIVARKRPEPKPKREPRRGGQPDGSSHMGAWGGWALAPNTASMGRDFAAPTYIGREGSPNVQTARHFFMARRADWPREQPPCRKPWRHPARSSPWSWEPADGPGLFQRDGCREPPRPAPPAR